MTDPSRRSNGSTLVIPLLRRDGTQIGETFIDAADLALIGARRWSLMLTRECRYAATYERRAGGSYRTVLMHRLILGEPESRVDHRNRNGLDNRRHNLRLASASQNGANRPGWRDGPKGVSRGWSKKWNTDKWAAGITIDRRRVHLGYFDTQAEAARAYDAAALAQWGEFAFLNEAR